jgi:MYXO-CTERM domain-containing protein
LLSQTAANGAARDLAPALLFAGAMRQIIVFSVVLMAGAPAYADAVCQNGSHFDIELEHTVHGYLQSDVNLGAADQACAPSDLVVGVTGRPAVTSDGLSLELWVGPDCGDAAARAGRDGTHCLPLGVSDDILGHNFSVADARTLFPGLDGVGDAGVDGLLWLVVRAHDATVVDVCQQPIHEERRHPAPPFDVHVTASADGVAIDWSAASPPLATQTATMGFFVLCARDGQPLQKHAVNTLPYSMCVPDVRLDRVGEPLERGAIAGLADGDPAYTCGLGTVTTPHAAVIPPDDKPFQVVVVAFDAAGNATPSAVIDVPARHSAGGCSFAHGRADGAALMLIAVAFVAFVAFAARRRRTLC